MERQPGFELTKSFLHRMIRAVVYGDALMQWYWLHALMK